MRNGTSSMRCLVLIEAESRAGKAANGSPGRHGPRGAGYATLTEAVIKTLMVEDKWYASTRAAIDDEVQRLTKRLARRLQDLKERNDRPLRCWTTRWKHSTPGSRDT